MNIRATLGAVVLAASGSASMQAMAACTESFNLGSMGPPGVTTLYNDFYAPQHFDDCYNFTLSSSTDALGLTVAWDSSLTRDIDLTSVSLSGTGLTGTLSEPTPGLFSFSNLLAGTYQLIVSGNVTATTSRFASGPVGYLGVMATTRSFAAPVPEPETYAMLALGLAIVGWVTKRGKSQR